MLPGSTKALIAIGGVSRIDALFAFEPIKSKAVSDLSISLRGKVDRADDERSLRRALSEYVEHFHAERNHQGKGNVLLFSRGTNIRRATSNS